MANIYRTRVNISGGITGAGVSTMHWGVLDAPTDAAKISANLGAFWSAIKDEIATGTTVSLDPELETIDTVDGHLVDVDAITTWSFPGAKASEPLPWATHGLIRWRTGGTGATTHKEVRGRTFVPAPTEGVSTSGRPTSAYITVLQTAATTLVGRADTDLMIYSKANAVAFGVQSATVWGEWASLRSRRD